MNLCLHRFFIFLCYYKIKVNKGIGSITIDGKETIDGNEYGHGETYIDIDGGVGAIEIK